MISVPLAFLCFVSFSDKGVQWTDCSLEDHTYVKILTARTMVSNKAVQCCVKDEVSYAKRHITANNLSRLYTGVNSDVFWTLVQCMKQFGQDGISMPVADQILMTLMKLKLNLLHADLSVRFGVSSSFVSKTIAYWITTLAHHLTDLIIWLPREVIRSTMPECFKNYPNTTCIMDCAETLMQKSSDLKSRAESYSNYKAHNTVKYCVTISPSGYIMHVSKAYGGRSSDKYIVKDSGVLNNLLPGDEVMADRGFTIQDLLFPLQAKLNIPAFSHGKQLSDEEVTRTRRVANVRIHVERAIRRMKVYKVLRDTVPITMTRHIDEILRIVAALVNLDSDLISKNTVQQ